MSAHGATASDSTTNAISTGATTVPPAAHSSTTLVLSANEEGSNTWLKWHWYRLLRHGLFNLCIRMLFQYFQCITSNKFLYFQSYIILVSIVFYILFCIKFFSYKKSNGYGYYWKKILPVSNLLRTGLIFKSNSTNLLLHNQFILFALFPVFRA